MIKNLFRVKESITAKLIIAIGLLIISGSMIFWYAILDKQEKYLTSIAIKNGFSFIEYIKKSNRYNMLHFLRDEIQETLQDISIAEGVEGVRIFDHTGRIFYSTFEEDIAKQIDTTSIACRGCHTDIKESSELLSDPIKWNIYRKKEGFTALKLVEPIYNEPACYTSECHVHIQEQEILGFVEADLSLALLDEAKLKQKQALTAYVIIFILAISLSIMIILYKIVSKPVGELVKGMERVSKGDLDHSVSIKSSDEIGKLSEAFNSMTIDIKASRHKIEEWTTSLEEEVARKTEEIKKTHDALVQTEKLASLGRMAAGVAHEINNPLTGIVTFSYLLLKRFPPESTEAEDIQIIIDQTERCAKIIKNLLAFARASSTEKGEININDVLNKAIFMVKNQEKFHNIIFNLNIDDQSLKTIGEEHKFQQIFLNMLINAADAMNEKGSITVSTRKTSVEEKNYVEVEFTDTGSGINEKDMPKLFEPFFTTKPIGQGTGLGLSITHGIVSQFGGHINVKTKVGKGTSFFILLPLLNSEK